MIVKIRNDVWTKYTGENRMLLMEHEGDWLPCVRPDKPGCINVLIDYKIITINYRHVLEIINDDRHLYELCSYCSNVQDINLERCTNCGHTRDYLRPFYYTSDYEGFNAILEKSINSAFKLLC